MKLFLRERALETQSSHPDAARRLATFCLSALLMSIVMNDANSLLRRHHELFAEDGEPFGEDWAIEYFENYLDRLDVEHSGKTDAGNSSS